MVPVFRPKYSSAICQRFPAVLLICTLAVGVASCQPQPAAVAGASGIGDTYYPQLGNGGYDVQKYTLVLDVDPIPNAVTGDAIIAARAIDRLSAFNLDFQGLTVDAVRVNGAEAAYTRQDQELTITPKQALPAGRLFSVDVSYHGQPEYAEIITSKGAFNGSGWFHSADGSINVMSEPNGSSTWYPVNNHPRDKAAYRFEIRVPKPWVVAATGTLRNTVDEGEKTRYVWEMDQPMASYLASINIDKYRVETSPGPNGVMIRNYFPPELQDDLKADLGATGEMIEYFDSIFGPYPFHEYGVVVVDASIPPCTAGVGGSLEAQTMSVFCPRSSSLEESVVAHELAHQWFGDSVSLVNWQDLWLKEGMATYAEWLWGTRNMKADALNQLAQAEKDNLFVATKIGQPPAEDLYSWEQYVGGALTFHALRLKAGDEAFFKILRTYLERYRYGNASAQEFIALSEEISGQPLSDFFDSWLLQTHLPDLPEPR